MNKLSFIFRLTLVMAFVAAKARLAFHREFFAASRLEHGLQHLGESAPILFVDLSR